ncbi:MAG: DNA repair protein RecO [Eubacteriales bacterium]|nr:DNA repair protein RecO [Eubacteriales bacterium]
MNRVIRGIVIKEQPSGEKGKLLYVLTQNEGVLTVTATGARTISASYLKSAQLFAYSDLTVYDKNKHLTLTEAKLTESFYDLRKDVAVFALASYMSELSLQSAVPADDGILRLLLNCLYALSRKLADTDTVKAVFEYRLCLALGLAPDFSCCAICGEAGDRFDFEESAFFCGECAPNPESCFRLDEGAAGALNYLNSCPAGKILSFGIKGDSKRCFCDFCEKYLITASDLRPASLDFYKKIIKDT